MIQTLLLTGANNHDWRRTAPFLQRLLESTERFHVTTTETPSEALEGDLADFSLFVVDYNGAPWSELAQQNFASRVRAGAGVVIFHAADNAFAGWREYEQMCGLGFRKTSGHGEFHEFAVSISDTGHPATQGIAAFTTTDELYHGMIALPDAPFQVLATAFSSEEKGGTGKDEPILVATQFGAGRVFHTLLGHVWPGDSNGEYRGASLVALENAGFQQTFTRGCQWAAMGEIK